MEKKLGKLHVKSSRPRVVNFLFEIMAVIPMYNIKCRLRAQMASGQSGDLVYYFKNSAIAL